jgi:hypothetical protein
MSRNNTIEDFWSLVDKRGSNDCWEWLGSFDLNNLYGIFYANAIGYSFKGSPIRAHKLAYELTFGKIDPNLIIHHKCLNKWCCNPDHLDKMTNPEHLHLHRILRENSGIMSRREQEEQSQLTAKIMTEIRRILRFLNS